ncbi:hypothetical protein [Absidia glauca]|uniref:GH16 domain-containing protein n=1 Tax=Absidia glauca TaxID=4829 RepID=A0A163M349_ABSGL|nr:hypothetical protein [Absidia glauca]
MPRGKFLIPPPTRLKSHSDPYLSLVIPFVCIFSSKQTNTCPINTMYFFKLISTLLIGTVTLAPLVNTQLSSSPVTCDCGFRDENSNIWSNVWYSNYQQANDGHEGSMKSDPTRATDKNYMVMDYSVQRPGSDYKRIFSKNNVNMTPQSAQLIVRSNDAGEMTSASFGTQRNDFLYGTFRSTIKMPSAPGTVAAFYHYYNDTSEIDMETLGRYTDPRLTYFAIQPQIRNEDGSASNLTHVKYPLEYDPTTDFHEYRFDWSPGSVGFYLDGQLASTIDTNIPSSPGRIMLNHWTDGNPNFSGVAPSDQDVVMEIANLTFFFNSTKDTSGPPCQVNQNPCDVQDITSGKLLPEKTAVWTHSRGALYDYRHACHARGYFKLRSHQNGIPIILMPLPILGT